MSDKIQLYSLATPNGQKVAIALEEMELPYDAHKVDIMAGDQFTDDFKKINPNSKIPAILDGDLPIMESGAILLHLAEKTGKFLPKDPIGRSKTLQWLFFQVGGPGPMFGQFGHFFKYAKDKCDHEYPVTRYTNEAKRLLNVIDKQLDGKDWLMGDEYTIADMALAPWIVALDKAYGAKEQLELDTYKNVSTWVSRFLDRPAVKRGLKVTPFS